LALAAELELDVPLLELRGIRAGYGGVEALHGIDLAVPGGSIVAILGPNGAGKTTTLRVISGLVTPTAGSMLLEGHDVGGASTVALSRAGVCLIPEGRGIFPNLTVRENLLMDTYASGRSVDEIEEIAYGRFPRLGERRTQVAGTLSGGEQQMLALARALMGRPRLLLLDEPSLGLAPLVTREIFRIVRELNEQEGLTVLVVEQNAAIALEVAAHAYVLEVGEVAVSGSSEELARDESVRKSYLGY